MCRLAVVAAAGLRPLLLLQLRQVRLGCTQQGRQQGWQNPLQRIMVGHCLMAACVFGSCVSGLQINPSCARHALAVHPIGTTDDCQGGSGGLQYTIERGAGRERPSWLQILPGPTCRSECGGAEPLVPSRVQGEL